MPRRPVVLIHGYSDKGRSFARWSEILQSRGFDVSEVHIANYVSLSNEITIKDIAEGLDRALRARAGLGAEEPFDAIVHSTGMLVIRAWLTGTADRALRLRRLKHLVGLAPASHGSPLAHKGRSWLGAMFKGSRGLGPDFLEAGDEVLQGLELGSAFTWDLAHADLVGPEPAYTLAPDTPYVFTFCGDQGYGGLKSVVNPEASDGTVRWAGCSLDTRKYVFDLTAGGHAPGQRLRVAPFGDQEISLIPVSGMHHGSIVGEPTDELVELVMGALEVDSADRFKAWLTGARERTAATRRGMRRWQQFVIRLVDERSDPVPDWNLQLSGSARGRSSLQSFDLHVHVYQRDPSLRCFHVDLGELRPGELGELHLRLLANSGTELVAYLGEGSEKISADGLRFRKQGKWDARIELTPVLNDPRTRLFHPFTTTLIEMRINREPVPPVGANRVLWWT